MVQIEGLPSRTMPTLERVQQIREDLEAIKQMLEAATLLAIEAGEPSWPYGAINLGMILSKIEECRVTLEALEKQGKVSDEDSVNQYRIMTNQGLAHHVKRRVVAIQEALSAGGVPTVPRDQMRAWLIDLKLLCDELAIRTPGLLHENTIEEEYFREIELSLKASGPLLARWGGLQDANKALQDALAAIRTLHDDWKAEIEIRNAEEEAQDFAHSLTDGCGFEGCMRPGHQPRVTEDEPIAPLTGSLLPSYPLTQAFIAECKRLNREPNAALTGLMRVWLQHELGAEAVQVIEHGASNGSSS